MNTFSSCPLSPKVKFGRDPGFSLGRKKAAGADKNTSVAANQQSVVFSQNDSALFKRNQCERGTLDRGSGNLRTNNQTSNGMPHGHVSEDKMMSNDPPPFVHDGLDPAPEPKSTVAEVSEAVRGTANKIGGAIDAGKKPGMPLSILSNIAREAPLGSLLAALLLGVAVARRW